MNAPPAPQKEELADGHALVHVGGWVRVYRHDGEELERADGPTEHEHLAADRRSRMRRLRTRRAAHSATTAHACAAFPFVADGGLGREGIYIGRDAYAGPSASTPSSSIRR